MFGQCLDSGIDHNVEIETCPFRKEAVVPDGEELANPNLLSNNSRSAWRRSMFASASKRLGKFVKGDGQPVDVDSKIIHKYAFSSGERRREITLAHAESIWYIKVDDEVIASKPHKNTALKSFQTSVEFSIPDSAAPHGSLEPLSAKMTMDWIPRSLKWQYTLLVGDTIVPAYWSKSNGFKENRDLPEILPPRETGNMKVAAI